MAIYKSLEYGALLFPRLTSLQGRMGDNQQSLGYGALLSPRPTSLQGRMGDNQRIMQLLTKQVDVNTELVGHLAELLIEPAGGDTHRG